MLAFISYPREFEKFANELVTELKMRGIKSFLDKENIEPTKLWKLEIEKNIEEADIFIVLYLPSAAIEGRYFYTEINRIQKNLETSLKNLITVTFPPTKPADLLFFYRNYQLIQASSNGVETNHWLDPIVTEIERLKKIKEHEQIEQERINKKSKIQTISILAILILGIVLSYLLYEQKEKLVLENQKLKTELVLNDPESPKGEVVCNSLLGKCKLDQEYTFSYEKDAKSIANINTFWHAEKCIYVQKDDQYILSGTEYTDFDIEIPIEDKYIRIATITIKYPSEVRINNTDGKLVSRFFNAMTEPENVKKYPTGKDKKGPELNDDFIDQKIKEVLNFRDEKHNLLQTKGCEPAKGDKEHRLALAFICHDYTRVMVKMPV